MKPPRAIYGILLIIYAMLNIFFPEKVNHNTVMSFVMVCSFYNYHSIRCDIENLTEKKNNHEG